MTPCPSGWVTACHVALPELWRVGDRRGRGTSLLSLHHSTSPCLRTLTPRVPAGPREKKQPAHAPLQLVEEMLHRAFCSNEREGRREKKAKLRKGDEVRKKTGREEREREKKTAMEKRWNRIE